jgi:hypothetical protein
VNLNDHNFVEGIILLRGKLGRDGFVAILAEQRFQSDNQRLQSRPIVSAAADVAANLANGFIGTTVGSFHIPPHFGV